MSLEHHSMVICLACGVIVLGGLLLFLSGRVHVLLPLRRQLHSVFPVLLEKWLLLIGAALVIAGVSAVGACSITHPCVPSDQPRTDLELSGIEATLSERLPTSEVADRRHQDLVDAIRDVKSPVGPLGGRGPKWMFMGGAGLVLLTGLGAVWMGIANAGVGDSRPFVRSLLTAGTVLSASSLLSFGTLLSLGGLKLGDKVPITIPVTIGVSGGSGSTALAEIHLDCGEVGPFQVGKHDVLENHADSTLVQVRRRLQAHFPGYGLRSVLLIGSADRRPLRGSVVRYYDSNMGLAQARACWVRDQLGGLTIEREAIVSMSAGPSNVGIALSAEAFAKDRAVRVYATWSPLPTSETLGQQMGGNRLATEGSRNPTVLSMKPGGLR